MELLVSYEREIGEVLILLDLWLRLILRLEIYKREKVVYKLFDFCQW